MYEIGIKHRQDRSQQEREGEREREESGRSLSFF